MECFHAALSRAEWLNAPFTAKNGKRDQIENCHQWRGGRSSSELALINQINALVAAVVLFARKQRGGVSRKFDPFVGQPAEIEFNHWWSVFGRRGCLRLVRNSVAQQFLVIFDGIN